MAADLSAEAIKTQWGYFCTCSAGTAAAGAATTKIVPKGTHLSVQAIACGGAATTDITTVQDGNGKQVFKGAAVVNTLNSLSFSDPIRVDGLTLGFAGATTGYCSIYLSKE